LSIAIGIAHITSLLQFSSVLIVNVVFGQFTNSGASVSSIVIVKVVELEQPAKLAVTVTVAETFVFEAMNPGIYGFKPLVDPLTKPILDPPVQLYVTSLLLGAADNNIGFKELSLHRGPILLIGEIVNTVPALIVTAAVTEQPLPSVVVTV
jgi:hypothetical protein